MPSFFSSTILSQRENWLGQLHVFSTTVIERAKNEGKYAHRLAFQTGILAMKENRRNYQRGICSTYFLADERIDKVALALSKSIYTCINSMGVYQTMIMMMKLSYIRDIKCDTMQASWGL